ncbi:type II secretion system protein [Candidatus Nitronereus thalassa]|uniref:Type II secretion system protein n=1 Tax=Candidatus Nitronereus thalassa TaxID=3020898 RepID=A0ABU3K7L3_9BACT|nr:type II secretion system protein [Candidatus Nitronereus thalassa]MDT7042365.1 type II secretion system protein [Candidatus Nitronereus thalassa]
MTFQASFLKKRDTKYEIQDTFFSSRDTRYKIQDTSPQIRETFFSSRNTKYEIRNTRCAALNAAGFTLIEVIGVLAIMATLAAIAIPNVIDVFDRAEQTEETKNLQAIAEGVKVYFRENRTWPPNLAALSPKYVSFGSAQLLQNSRGYSRYYFAHPTTAGFSNATGLAESALPDMRFLLISDISANASPTIANATQFNAWWNTDETSTPNLKIYRGHLGNMFHLVSLSPVGPGGSYQIDGTSTGTPGNQTLALHNRYHVVGTPVKLDTSDSYSTPEVELNLTMDAGYQFDPNCQGTPKWLVQGQQCS